MRMGMHISPHPLLPHWPRVVCTALLNDVQNLNFLLTTPPPTLIKLRCCQYTIVAVTSLKRGNSGATLAAFISVAVESCCNITTNYSL